MSDQHCHVRACGAVVLDAFICQACTRQLAEDLRRIISGQRGESTVRNVGAVEEYYATGQPIRRTVQTGMREGTPVVVDEIRPGDFARQMSSPFDHDSGLFAELIAAYARQTRTGRGGAAAESPVVWHEKAGDLCRELAVTMVRAARLIADARGISLPDDASLLTLATWLERHVRWLRQQQAAAALVTDVHRLVAAILRIVDPLDDREFIGLCAARPLEPTGDCECNCHVKMRERPLCDDRELCTHRGALCATALRANLQRDVEITCPTCHQLYNVADYRHWLLVVLEDVLATATEISTALTSLDHPVTPERIRKWKERKRIEVRGYRPRYTTTTDSLQVDPLYRLGDVKALRDVEAAASARRDARKAG